MSVLIKADNLSYSTPDGRALVQGLSIELSAGEVGLIRGPNGIGKSTLLRIIRGELRPTSGGCQVSALSTAFLSQLQNREFHIPLRLSDVVSFGFPATQGHTPLQKYSLLTPKELDLPWNSASGGERQKALLTQALASDAQLLILDEPCNHLDENSEKSLTKILNELTAGNTRAVLMVCHQTEEADFPRSKVWDLSRHQAS